VAGILEGLAQGFRSAGAVYSPSVYNVQRQEEQTALDRKERNKQLTLGVLVKAAESGALPPDKFQEAMKKLGIDMPSIGQSTESQLHGLKLNEAQDLKKRQQQFDSGSAATQPGNSPNLDGTAPPIPSEANRTNFDEYMLRAEQATKLRLKDEAERYTKLAELELKKKEKSSDIGTLLAERDAIAAKNPEDPRLAVYDKFLATKTDSTKNVQFEEFATGESEDGKPKFQKFRVSPDGTMKKEGAPYVKGSSVEVNNFPQPIAVTDADGNQKMVQFTKDGKVKETSYAPPDKNKVTDTERLAKGYHDRMVAAEAIITKEGTAGHPTLGTYAASKAGTLAERSVQTKEQQKYRQAQEDWVRSKLRRESGAVIAADEMDREISTYFPQVGDSKEVIAQKADARAVAIQAMRDSAGPAIKDLKPAVYGSSKEIRDAMVAGKLTKAQAAAAFEEFYLQNPDAE
jgi:hypothetical protein